MNEVLPEINNIGPTIIPSPHTNPSLNQILENTSLSNDKTDYKSVTGAASSSEETINLSMSDSPSNESIQKPRQQKPRITIGKILTITLLILSLLIFGGGTFFVLSGKPVSVLGDITGQSTGDILSGIFSGFIKNNQKLQGEDEGRTNILISGVDEGGYLADTLIILSYFYETHQFVTISIPRDLTVDSKYGQVKINEFYSYAEQNRDRSGPVEMSDLIQREWQIKIHYWTQINFRGVEDLINQVGGVDVNVLTTFTDCEFPGRNMVGYLPCQTFQAGANHFDGFAALVYARSRHGNNGEGSDFKRSERQSIVIEALLKKMKQDAGKDLFNYKKINDYLTILGKNLRMSLKADEIKHFYEVLLKQLASTPDLNFKRINWETDGKIYCAGIVQLTGYHISYCDGKLVGQSGNSVNRDKARAQVKDPLGSAKGSNSGLDNASAIVLGNANPNTKPIFDELKKNGLSSLCDDCYSNIYSYAKKSTVKNVSIYIVDDQLRKQFDDKFKDKLSFKYTLDKSLPSSRVLSSNNQGTDIIVWVE